MHRLPAITKTTRAGSSAAQRHQPPHSRARRHGQSRAGKLAERKEPLSNEIELARHRLEVLHGERTVRHILSWDETRAIRTLLDELHRLNLAVSKQRRQLERRKPLEKASKATQKKNAGPQARRSPMTQRADTNQPTARRDRYPRSAPRSLTGNHRRVQTQPPRPKNRTRLRLHRARVSANARALPLRQHDHGLGRAA